MKKLIIISVLTLGLLGSCTKKICPTYAGNTKILLQKKDIIENKHVMFSDSLVVLGDNHYEVTYSKASRNRNLYNTRGFYVIEKRGLFHITTQEGEQMYSGVLAVR